MNLMGLGEMGKGGEYIFDFTLREAHAEMKRQAFKKVDDRNLETLNEIFRVRNSIVEENINGVFHILGSCKSGGSIYFHHAMNKFSKLKEVVKWKDHSRRELIKFKESLISKDEPKEVKPIEVYDCKGSIPF